MKWQLALELIKRMKYFNQRVELFWLN